jgi:Zn-dependent protease with chaperone function
MKPPPVMPLAICLASTSACERHVTEAALPTTIDALYFDGLSARPLPVRVWVDDEPTPQLHAQAADNSQQWQWPLGAVQWPETTRHGARVLHLQGGGSLQVDNAATFDQWRGGMGRHDGWVVRAQQNWRWTALAALSLVLVLAAGWRWGVPVAARAVVAVLPLSVDEAVGQAALKSIEDEGKWLKPSALPQARQEALRQALAAAVADHQRAHPEHQQPSWRLKFAAADKAIGPNAFALPGGTLVVTDALVELLKGEDDALIGVMAHELGHVQHRHGMRGVVQASVVGAAASLMVGDFSTLLAAVPALIAQLSYSRDAEREADAHAVQVLRASGRSPAAMVVLFERLQPVMAKLPRLPIALASHPADDERIRFFREAAR